MPASMTELLGNRRRIDIPKADGSPGIYVIYRPQTITPRRLHELLALEQAVMEEQSAQEGFTESEPAAATNDDDAASFSLAVKRHEAVVSATDEMVAEFAKILIDWDLTDDEGNLIPPTREGLQGVDLDVTRFIFAKIREDSRMGETTGANSQTPLESTSKPKAQRATSRRRSRSGTR